MTEKVVDAIKNTIDPATDEFTFKADVDMNALANEIRNTLAKTIKVDPKNVKCKGFRLFYVDTESNMLISSGLFVNNFSPEDWDDDGE
jgi:hypothetical protein